MRSGPDGALLAVSLAFAGAAGLGSAVAVRDQLPGQPFGISVPVSVPAGLLAGWGAGVAAPWPMPVAAVLVAARAQRTPSSALAGAICAGIGVGCIVGTAIEPVSWLPPVLDLVDQVGDRLQCGGVSGPDRGRVAPLHGRASLLSHAPLL
jgi:hypothetical protein